MGKEVVAKGLVSWGFRRAPSKARTGVWFRVAPGSGLGKPMEERGITWAVPEFPISKTVLLTLKSTFDPEEAWKWQTHWSRQGKYIELSFQHLPADLVAKLKNELKEGAYLEAWLYRSGAVQIRAKRLIKGPK